jgi:hypothetical protein
MTRRDNSNLAAKLELRRHFLRKYHATGDAWVFDAFQAQGVIWTQLKNEFSLESYWGVDLLEKKGRLRVDSARVLAQRGWRENVIDLDAYGSPWKHWHNLLGTAGHSLTVFLTLGSLKGLKKRVLTRVEKTMLGIDFKLPPAISGKLSQITVDWMLAQACARFAVVEALEARPCETARYFGLRLELKPEPMQICKK